jgi:hypothetical protein
MVFLILVFVAASGAANPAPAMPVGPLKEIGQVHASANMCGALVVHANSAISAALRDDLLITRTIGRMRSSNLEGEALSRRQAMNDLDRLAAELRETETQGIGEVNRLRDLGAKTGDATHKVELKTFADALGGALNRQGKIADDLNGLLAYLDYQELRGSSFGDSDNMPSPSLDASGSAGQSPAVGEQHGGSSFEHATPNVLLISAAADYQARMPEVQKDEAKAADHSEGAVSGC